MGDVVPLFDPDAPLRGKPREVAMAQYREAVDELTEHGIRDLFNACCRLPVGQDLSIEDASRIFMESFRDLLKPKS